MTYVSRWHLRALAPIVLMSPFAVIAWWSPDRRARAQKTLVLLAALMFIFAVGTVMEVWVCSSDGLLRESPSITCGESEWAQLLSVSIVLFLLYGVGFPASMARLAYTEHGSWIAYRGC